MKKVLTLFLVLVASKGMLLASDTCVDGIWYDFDNSDYTASVTFRGSRYTSFSDEYSGSIVIPDSVTYINVTYCVTSIGTRAFYGCNGLTSVTIGNNVTSIGGYAFNGCTGLTSLIIPSSVTSIGNRAFQNCTALPIIDNLRYADTYLVESVDKSLTTYIIRGNTKWIGDNAFSSCSGLISIEIPNSVTSIGNNAFHDCSGLTSITIPNSVTSIGNNAFYECNHLTSVTIGNSVTSIGERAFFGCNGLISVTIPNSVTSIGNTAFSYCTSLTSLTIGNGVTSIGSSAFSYCTSMTSLTIGNSVTSIGNNAFHDCCGLTSLIIPHSVTSIGSSAFYGCSSLTSVTIGKGVTSILDYAFDNCDNLTDIYATCGDLERVSELLKYDERVKYAPLPYTITVNVTNGSVAISPEEFTECSNITLTATPNEEGYYFIQWSDGNSDNPRAIELTQDTAFTAEFSNQYSVNVDCDEVYGTIDGENGTFVYNTEHTYTAIPNYGYYFVHWSDGVTNNPRTIILTNDTSLTAEFAKNTYSLTYNAVNGSISGNSTAQYLDEVTLTAVPDYGYHFTQWNDGNTDNPRTIILTQDTAFTAEFAVDMSGQCGNNLTWSLEDNILTITGNGDMWNEQPWVISHATIMQVFLPQGITSIGNGSFKDCAKLTTITIPALVTEIGSSAFMNGNRLQTITLGSRIETIGENAFANCPYLITIHAYMEFPPIINANVFADCGDLSLIDCYVPEDSYAFYRKTNVWKEFNLLVETDPEPTPTAVSEVQSDKVQSTKVLRNGQLLILRGEKVYTVTGQEVR